MSLLCFSRISEKMGLDLTAFPKSVVFVKIFKNMTEIQSCDLQLLATNTSMAVTRVLHLGPTTLSLQEVPQVLYTEAHHST